MSTKKLREEVLVAFQDCHEVKVKGDRNLSYRASEAVDGKAFVSLMGEACPNGYNSFDADVAARVVELFGEDARYTIAREGSPCVYVRPAKRLWLDRNIELIDGLADELSFEESGEFRIWWD